MTGQAVLRVGELPERALDAAAAFHSGWLEIAREMLGETESLVVVVPRAGYDHADWRRAAVRDLARQAAPTRVNMLAGDDEDAIAATLAYLAQAPGVTGQLLEIGGGKSADPA